jgi:hypothetical protein
VRVIQTRRRFVKKVRVLEPSKMDCQILIVALDFFAKDLASDDGPRTVYPFEAKDTLEYIGGLREALVICAYGSKPQSPNVERSEPVQAGEPSEAKIK